MKEQKKQESNKEKKKIYRNIIYICEINAKN